MAAKVSTEKVWATADGKRLVKDGDPEAAHLVAAKGHRVSVSRLEQYENADDFFEDPTENHPKQTVNEGGALGRTAPEHDAPVSSSKSSVTLTKQDDTGDEPVGKGGKAGKTGKKVK